jgi:RNA polymerase Rpb4
MQNSNDSYQQRHPTLLSNLEVLEIVQKRVQARSNSNDTQKRKRNISQLQHRDWVEEHVLQYCQGTPCVKLQTLENANQLEYVLTSPKRMTVMKPPRTEHSCEETAEENNMLSAEDSEILENRPLTLSGFGLMEAEALQVLNFVPTEAVELHLMIEDLQSRMTESEQEMLLKKIAEFATIPSETSGTLNVTDETTTNTDLGNNEYEEEIVYEDGYENNENCEDKMATAKVKVCESPLPAATTGKNGHIRAETSVSSQLTTDTKKRNLDHEHIENIKQKNAILKNVKMER